MSASGLRSGALDTLSRAKAAVRSTGGPSGGAVSA